MKSKLLLSIFILSLSVSAAAQDGAKTYAITGNGDFQWMNIRQIDLSTGAVTKNIFEKGITKFKIRNAVTGKEVMLPNQQNAIQPGVAEYPTATMVAAAAYDNKHNKLFFTPMFLSELRWLDLSSNAENPEFYSLKDPLLNVGNLNDQANQFTRMAIAADGNGYALTNNANHLIKFTTGKKVVITDLGNLIDASLNEQVSIHDKINWGGDCVADALGNLYLFTAAKKVFKIDIKKRIALFIGSIKGLSESYTVNGAAVDNDDHVIISSANTFEGLYKVNMKDLSSEKLNSPKQIFNASDLANGNLLFTKNVLGAASLKPEIIDSRVINIYPNPVTKNQFQVNFKNHPTGTYTVALTDLQGKVIMNKQVIVKSTGQIETFMMKAKPAGGMYFINVTDVNKRSLFSDKIVVE